MSNKLYTENAQNTILNNNSIDTLMESMYLSDPPTALNTALYIISLNASDFNADANIFDIYWRAAHIYIFDNTTSWEDPNLRNKYAELTINYKYPMEPQDRKIILITNYAKTLSLIKRTPNTYQSNMYSNTAYPKNRLIPQS